MRVSHCASCSLTLSYHSCFSDFHWDNLHCQHVAWIFPSSLTHLGSVFFPPAKSKAARFIGLPPSPPTLSVAPCPLTSAPCAGQMVLQSLAAAICNRIWGYEHISLCVRRLFTDNLPDGPTHSMCCVWKS